MSVLKRLIMILSLLFGVLLVIPLITINTVKADAGMLVTLILFFIINPLLSVFIGIIAGKDVRLFWFSPFLIGVLFWLFSSLTYKTAFPFVYSIAYIIISAIAMVITHLLKNKKT